MKETTTHCLLSMHRLALFISLLTLGILPFVAAEAQAAPAPAWKLSVTSAPTNFPADSSGEPEYFLVATNVGAGPTSGTITITNTLPADLTSTQVFPDDNDPTSPDPSCKVSGQTVTCTDAGPIHPGLSLLLSIRGINVSPLAPESVLNDASISGGGAPSATAATTTTISSSPAPFDFLAGETGLAAPFTEPDGGAATQAGSHPYQLTADLGFPIERPGGGFLTGADGGLRDAIVDLPRGTIVDPAATPVLCTEAELTSQHNPGCPARSQIGVVTVTTSVVDSAQLEPTNLYNMVPPPGKPSAFGFDVGGFGIFPHIFGSVRSDGDYGLSGGSTDVLALGKHPVLSVRLELWGDPSSPIHDHLRGLCLFDELSGSVKTCPVEAQKTPLLTTPSECPGQPTTTRAHADSWEDPGIFHEASYESADLAGNPVSIDGCNKLEFKPTIESQPSTNLADSPSGLDFKLHQSQNLDLESLSTAALRDATVTLPAGMAVNPSSADGQAACSASEIGLTSAVGQSPVRFTKEPDSCPDAAKIGKVEVSTPLLAEIDEATRKVQHDSEGNPIPRVLEGQVYLAKPFENPFGSLLAIYFSVEDPKSGTVAKLAGEVSPDPITGQLTSTFTENPQLPLEDIELHVFGGPRAPLVTPLACGTHTTTSNLTPWSSPEGADANPSDSFETTNAPDGGTCPSAEDQAQNTPVFSAGTISPQAGAYSPFVLKLSREDGSQRLAKIDVTLPPGLSGKLAGIAECSEAQIAQAQSRSHPNQGALEQQSPSCPTSSEVGTVDVAAGAGITPLHTTGHAYLAGPYKGAPLSMAIVTPAVAGPFDLGAVTVRTALYLNPQSAQIHAVSDPLPTILEGIPLDVRSVYLRMGRPQFVLNPTSCDPMAIAATSTSVFNQSGALSSPFQVGGCEALGFKPKLSIRLKGKTDRGGHPALTAIARFREGDANTKRASVALPRSAFLDQAHIRTVCTRVQFAADQCPQGSIYGHAKAITPLLDNPLEGPVYLRSSDHQLPDLVAALSGQVDVELVGRVDSIRGGIRSTFEAAPDAPVSSFVLKMQGGSKGLLINSADLCSLKASARRATVQMDAQNGKTHDFEPVVKNSCHKKAKKRKRR